MRKRIFIMQFISVCIVTLLLSGCLKGEQSLGETDSNLNESEREIADDTEEKVIGVEEDDENTEGDIEETEEVHVNELVERQLYLVDADGMVVPQTLSIPADESKAVAKQVLTYLIKDGPVTEFLPNGFQAVLPANTEILGLKLLDDGTLIVDVSDDFNN